MLFNRILINLVLLAQGKIKLREIPPKIINRVFNYSKLARLTRRSKFAICDVIFRPIEANDKSRYFDFIRSQQENPAINGGDEQWRRFSIPSHALRMLRRMPSEAKHNHNIPRLLGRGGSRLINSSFKENVLKAEKDVSIPRCNSEAFCYVALYLNRIIGKVEIRRARSDSVNIWQVGGMSVLEDFRGYGIGEELFKKVLSAVFGKDHVIFLDVDKDNKRAIKLYRKIGFKVANEQEKSMIKTIKYAPGKIIMVLDKTRAKGLTEDPPF